MPTSPTAIASATRTMPTVLTASNLLALNGSGFLRADPLEVGEASRPHADEAQVFEDVAEFVLAEESAPPSGRMPQRGPADPAFGTITAMRPPGRSTLAISASAAPGLGISCNMATEVTASTVSSRNGNCWASARKKPTWGPASARTARASIGSEMSTPSARPSGPAARASDAVTFPGPLPTSSATPPDGMLSHSIGACQILSTLRAIAWALS